MLGIYGMECCGINEINDLSYTLSHSTVEKVVSDLAKRIMGDDGNKYDGDNTCAFLLFTGISPYKSSNRLKDFIERNNLGDVTETPIRRNPNSGNNLKCYIWSLDHRAIHNWRKEWQRKEEGGKDERSGKENKEGTRVPRHHPVVREVSAADL